MKHPQASFIDIGRAGLLRKSFALLLLSLILLALPARAQGSVVHFFLFYGLDCTQCQAIEEEVLAPLSQKYGERLEIKRFEISIGVNYEVLRRLEGEYGLPISQIPAIFIGDRVLIGADEIRGQLVTAIEGYLATGGVDFPTPDEPVPYGTPTPGPTPTPCGETLEVCELPTGPPYPVYLAYFSQAGCIECDRVSYDLAYLEQKYPNLRVESFDIREHMSLNEALCERYKVPVERRLIAPAIFVGDDYLIGQEINVERLEELIERYSQEESEAPWRKIREEEESGAHIIERFRSFTLLTIMGAGLVDGLNPCAFATIIFFVSYLAMIGRRGKEILLVGSSFTAAVFLTYLLVGLGVLGFVRSLPLTGTVSRLIYGFTALLCFVLVGLSLHDYSKIKQGKIVEMTLRLPRPLQRSVHGVIRETSMKGYLGATFVAGFLVSLLELACTGQVYLPTIIFVTGIPELRMNGIFYLLLYNLMFILPLVAIFILTFYGTTSLQLSRFLQTKAATVRLLTALLFAILGVWLILALI
jgi:cytochrome c biogenesis protein CcdA